MSGFAGGSVRPNLIRTEVSSTQGAGGTKKATVSLNDCLACSGCVTSAETVLISKQSTDEFLGALRAAGAARAAMGAGGLARTDRSDANGPTEVAVSISPQARASIAAELGISAFAAHKRLAALFERLARRHGLPRHSLAVLDLTATADVALLEAAREFVARYRKCRETRASPGVSQPLTGWGVPVPPPVSVAISSVETHYPDHEDSLAASAAAGAAQTVTPVEPDPSLALPMLSSECPGWVCYAEKTQPNALPFISTTKSSQQLMGAFIKRWGALSLGERGSLPTSAATHVVASDTIPPARSIYHVTVAPCYDKKLEATRNDFRMVGSGTEAGTKRIAVSGGEGGNDGANGADELVADVDCVLTADEVMKLLLADEAQTGAVDAREGAVAHTSPIDPRSEGLEQGAESRPEACTADLENILGVYVASGDGDEPILAGGTAAEGGGSGGYLDFIFRYAALELFGRRVDGPLRFVRGRNNDFHETWLELEPEASTDGATNPGKVKNKVLRFARAYGFRNIQTVVNKLKRNTCPYDYVEIMACPGGCLNGGGQVQSQTSGVAVAASIAEGQSSGETAKMRLAAVSTTFHTRALRSAAEGPLAAKVYATSRVLASAGSGEQDETMMDIDQKAGLLSAHARHLLHTRYHAVPKMEKAAPLGIKW